MPPPTLRDRVVSIARAEVGVAEAPLGSNTGPRVRQYQSSTILPGTGWPWCAAFDEWTWEEAGLAEHPANPSTYHMCRIAAARGELDSTPTIGGAIIWCGTHTGLVVGIDGNVVYTVEGNSGDRVASRTRAIAGAQFINPKGLGVATSESLLRSRAYFIEDVGAAYLVKGPWRRRAYADKALAGLKPDLRRLAKVVVTGDDQFVLRIGQPRTYGPWWVEAYRDNAERTLEQRLGRELRPYSRLMRHTPTGEAESLGKTT